MKATPGRIVMVAVHPDYNNGADEAPAIICRTWNDPVVCAEAGEPGTVAPGAHPPHHELVNVRVQLDGPDVPWLTSVPLFESRAAAEAAHEAKFADVLVPAARPLLFAAWWPPRAEHQPGDRPARF